MSGELASVICLCVAEHGTSQVVLLLGIFLGAIGAAVSLKTPYTVGGDGVAHSVANGTVHTRKVETTSNPADLFTKCLPCHIIESHLASLHMYTRSFGQTVL